MDDEKLRTDLDVFDFNRSTLALNKVGQARVLSKIRNQLSFAMPNVARQPCNKLPRSTMSGEGG
jgi:hypothetical protein